MPSPICKPYYKSSIFNYSLFISSSSIYTLCLTKITSGSMIWSNFVAELYWIQSINSRWEISPELRIDGCDSYLITQTFFLGCYSYLISLSDSSISDFGIFFFINLTINNNPTAMKMTIKVIHIPILFVQRSCDWQAGVLATTSRY